MSQKICRGEGFFFNDTATTEIYTLSLHDALPICRQDPLYPWSGVFDAVFLGSACQFGPLHRIETECRCGALHQRIGTLSEDMLGYAMQRQNPAEIFDLGCQVAQRL